MEASQRKAAVAWLSVLSNTTLVVLKIIVGLLIGSVSVISEAIHSGVDLVAAIIALFAVKTSAKPADNEHPFGHGKFENVSGTIEALLIFVAAGWIIYEAVHKAIAIFAGQHPQGEMIWGVGIMLVSATANLIVSHMLFKVGRQTESVALQADGWHLRTDVYTSAGVMVGLALIWVGSFILPEGSRAGQYLHLIDPLAAIVVAVLIIRAAWHLTLESGRDLLDVPLPAHEEAWVRDLLMAHQPTVRGFHHLRTRKSGHHRFIECHIFVDGKMTVEDSHRLSHDIAHHVREHFTDASITIHIEPCGGECDRKCSIGCFLTDQQRHDMQGRQNQSGR